MPTPKRQRTSPGAVLQGTSFVREVLLLGCHLHGQLVTGGAGAHNGDLRARAGNLGRSHRVESRPVEVRVSVVECRDRGLRRHDGRNAEAVEGHRVGGLLTERGVERLTTVAEHVSGIEHHRRRTRVDRQSLATTGVADGVVVGARTVGVPDQETVLVWEALHPVGPGVGPAEVVRTRLQSGVVTRVDAVLGQVDCWTTTLVEPPMRVKPLATQPLTPDSTLSKKVW